MAADRDSSQRAQSLDSRPQLVETAPAVSVITASPPLTVLSPAPDLIPATELLLPSDAPLPDSYQSLDGSASATDDAEQVDPAIIEALKSPKERIYVLRIGELMESLITERSATKPNPKQSFVTATTYQRLLIHRCSGHYKLVVEPDNNAKAITVFANAESRMPSRRISELVPPEQNLSGPAFKIMRRSTPDQRSGRTASSSGSLTPALTGPQNGTTPDESTEPPAGASPPAEEDPILKSLGLSGNRVGRSAEAPSKRHLTIEERTNAYNEARSRIFMDFKEEDAVAAVISPLNKEGERDVLISNSTNGTAFIHLSDPAASALTGSYTMPHVLSHDGDSSTQGLMTQRGWDDRKKSPGGPPYNPMASTDTSVTSSMTSPSLSPNIPPMTYPTLYDPRGSTSGAAIPDPNLDGDGLPVNPGQQAHPMYQMYPYYPPYPPPMGMHGIQMNPSYGTPYPFYPAPNGWPGYPSNAHPSDPNVNTNQLPPPESMNGMTNVQNYPGQQPLQHSQNPPQNQHPYWIHPYPPPHAMNQQDNQNNGLQSTQLQSYPRNDHPPQMAYPYPGQFPMHGTYYQPPPVTQPFPQNQQPPHPPKQLWSPNQPQQPRPPPTNASNLGNMQRSIGPGGPTLRHAQSQPPPALTRPPFNPRAATNSTVTIPPPANPWTQHGISNGAAPSPYVHPSTRVELRVGNGMSPGPRGNLPPGQSPSRDRTSSTPLGLNGAGKDPSGRNLFGRNQWSYGPGVGQPGSATQLGPGSAIGLTSLSLGRLGGGPSGYATEMSPRTDRRRSGSIAGSTTGSTSGSLINGGGSGSRTPLDETSSIASSSASSSSSRKTFTSTSSKHPLPPRPDWAVGILPATHPAGRSGRGGSTHRSSSSSSSASNPAHSRGHSTHQTPMVTPPHVGHQPLYPHQPSNDRDFPPLPGAPSPGEKLVSGVPTSVWNSQARMSLKGPTPHLPNMTTADTMFVRPPSKPTSELYDPKASKRSGPSSNSTSRVVSPTPSSTIGIRLNSGTVSPSMMMTEDERVKRDRDSLAASALLVEQINKLTIAAKEGKSTKEIGVTPTNTVPSGQLPYTSNDTPSSLPAAQTHS